MPTDAFFSLTVAVASAFVVLLVSVLDRGLHLRATRPKARRAVNVVTAVALFATVIFAANVVVITVLDRLS